MFGYNVLSDLKNGELVIPIKKDGDFIICLNSNGEEIKVVFNEFDFDKTPDERLIVVLDSSDDISSEEESSNEEIIENSNEEESSNEEIIENSEESSNEEIEIITKKYKNNFIEDNNEKIRILRRYGFSYNKISDVNIWEDEI